MLCLPAKPTATRFHQFLLGACALLSAATAFAQQEIPLWKDGAPGLKHEQPEAAEDRHETGRLDRYVSFVSVPTLTIYPAAGDAAANPAVLVVPGGGFRYVCIDKEGVEVAHWLNTLGLTAAVLKYRTIAPTAERNVKTIEALLQLGDTPRAMRVLRQHAAEFKIDPRRIGVMGFSAGGSMAVRLAATADAGDSAASDPIDTASSRPDFVALIYTGLPPGKMKAGKSTPPFFIAHAADDPKAPVGVATKIFQHIIDGGGSAELHIFSKGNHGFGVMPASGAVRDWTTNFADWLRDQGVLAPEGVNP